LAAAQLPLRTGSVRTEALNLIADRIEKKKQDILEANQIDLERAAQLAASQQISVSLVNRLKLDKAKIAVIVTGIRHLAEKEDPIGKETWGMQLDDGLDLYRVNCPIGVIGVIFESRPDALPQIASLCVRTANAVILKGGKEAQRSNKVLFSIVRHAIEDAGLPSESIELLESRAAVEELLKADGLVDLIIPRGSNQLVSHIQNNTHIPVLGHAEGICHIYIDRLADLEQAINLVEDAKVQYPSACNAVETVLIHRDVAAKLLPELIERLSQSSVEIRLDGKLKSLYDKAIGIGPTAKKVELACDEDWSTEYCDLIVSVKQVETIEEAIEHINQYGSHHTDTIVSTDKLAFEKFFAAVNSAGVYWNASTRFSDGFRYGFGAEVGISTGKLHPRGPVGLEGLVTYKYKLIGNGQTVSDYSDETGKAYKHKRLL
jgi:glutamate-5-semialdehyde dehydrogenase